MCRYKLHVVKSYTSEAHLGGLRQALVPKRNAEEGTGGSRTKTIGETIGDTIGGHRERHYIGIHTETIGGHM